MGQSPASDGYSMRMLVVVTDAGVCAVSVVNTVSWIRRLTP